MNNEIITRSEARSQELTHFYTGIPCKLGHLSRRYTNTGKCTDCVKARDAARRRSDPEKSKASTYRWREENPERFREYMREYRRANRDRILALRNYEAERLTNDMWRKENKHRLNANQAKRNAAKLQRTPQWVDLDQIAEIYRTCPKGHEVDHDIPMQGTHVSGLHVPENLQHLAIEENKSKGNRYDYWWLKVDVNLS